MKKQELRVLLSPTFIARLETLRLLVRQRFRGAVQGERFGRRRGSSLEFAEYREYIPGDDLRHLDWNLLARLDRPYLKTFVEEEDLYVSFLLDASASMGFGMPKKLDVACCLTAALAYLALGNLDRVALATFDGNLRDVLPSVRGKERVFSILHSLEELKAQGETSILKAIGGFLRSKASRPGLAVLVSDFLDPIGLAEGLKSLAGRGWEVLCLHVLDPVIPPMEGDLLLVDAETGEQVEVSVTPTLLREYEQERQAHIRAVCDCSRRIGCAYLNVPVQKSMEDHVLGSLRAIGLVGR